MSQRSPLAPPEATTWSVDDILRRVREGQLRIPDFQRSFRWEKEHIRNLFDSIYRGYPIGNLLLWETTQAQGTTTRFGPVRIPPSSGRFYVVVDGQQRITSLVATLMDADDRDAKFRLFFDLETGKFTHHDESQVPDTWLPLPEVADTVRFLEWLQARKLPGDLVAAANRMVRALRDYRVPVYIVRTDEESRVREIFERMNTGGKPLRAAEIFNALHHGRQEVDLHGIAAKLHHELGLGVLPDDWVLKAVAVILGVDIRKNLSASLRAKDKDIPRALEDTGVALQRVLTFLRDDVGLLSLKLLPYRVPLIPLTKLFHLIPDPSVHSRRLLTYWLWRGAWSGEHERSAAPNIRDALSGISEDERSTIDHLLSSVPEKIPPFELRRHNFGTARTKLACAALASLGPRHLDTGEPMEVGELLEVHGPSAFRLIVTRTAKEPESYGTQNRLLHPPISALRDALVSAPAEVLSSHCVPSEARDALALGDTKQFLALRKQSLETLVRTFLEERTTDEPKSSAATDPAPSNP